MLSVTGNRRDYMTRRRSSLVRPDSADGNGDMGPAGLPRPAGEARASSGAVPQATWGHDALAASPCESVINRVILIVNSSLGVEPGAVAQSVLRFAVYATIPSRERSSKTAAILFRRAGCDSNLDWLGVRDGIRNWLVTLPEKDVAATPSFDANGVHVLRD